jgi:predicted outer membrane repeat protein
MTITESAIVENKAGSNAGGIDNSDSALTIINSAINDNEVLPDGNNGGGIDTEDGDPMLMIVNSSVNGNACPSNGGGVYISGADATIEIVDTDISGNEAGVNGGGIRAGGANTMTITGSTISDNDADRRGGGMEVTADELFLENVTISGNRATESGGGFYVASDSILNIAFGTIADNTAEGVDNGGGAGAGGGIFNDDGAVILINTILADNICPVSDPDCFGTITSGGFNLIEMISANCAIAGDATGNVTGEDPLLVPLNSNGGPTRTHALQADSPAIDAAGVCLPTDQRGEPRPQDGDNDNDDACDIGAFERSADTPPLAPPVACCGAADPLSTPLLGIGLLSLKVARRRRAG